MKLSSLFILLLPVASSGLAMRVPFVARPTLPPISSAMDLMCLRNMVNHVHQDEDMQMTLETTLQEQRSLMKDRIHQINDILPTLQVSVHHDAPKAASSKMAHKNVLSHMDFMCIVNQIPHFGSDETAIVNTLQQDRKIAASHIVALEESLETLLAPTIDIENVEQNVESLLDSISHVLTMEELEKQAAATAILGAHKYANL